MIRIIGKTENPGACVITISFTMSFQEWGKVLEVLSGSSEGGSYPLWKVRAGIQNVLNAIAKSYAEVINDDEADMRRRGE